MTPAQLRYRFLAYAALWFGAAVLISLVSAIWPDSLIALILGKPYFAVGASGYFYGRARQIPRLADPGGRFDDGGRQRIHLGQ